MATIRERTRACRRARGRNRRELQHAFFLGERFFLPICLHLKVTARLLGSYLSDCVQGVAYIRFGVRFSAFCNVLRLWLRAGAMLGTHV